MKNTRIDMSFGRGRDTVIYSVRSNSFYSYEIDRKKLHARYGGKQYYFSNSGLSGAGYLEPDPAENDIIVFGSYQTDANEQKIATVHSFGGHTIFGYAPISAHRGITNGYPFVLTDGEKVIFCPFNEVRENLLGWDDLDWAEGKKIKVTYFDWDGESYSPTFTLLNPNRYMGINAVRFVDLRAARECVGHSRFLSIFEEKVRIVEHENDDRWFHLSFDGYFDALWNQDPRQIEGEIASGWYGAGNGFYWRRGRRGVQAFMEMERSLIFDGKYVVKDKTSFYVDYEQNFSPLEWYSLTTEGWKEYFLSKCLRKARQDYVYAITCVGVDTRRLMEQNLEEMICVQDSLDCGNCSPGTNAFISRHGINLNADDCISVKDLLDNEGIEKMLLNFDFQKVIHQKLVDPDQEIPLLTAKEKVFTQEDDPNAPVVEIIRRKNPLPSSYSEDED